MLRVSRRTVQWIGLFWTTVVWLLGIHCSFSFNTRPTTPGSAISNATFFSIPIALLIVALVIRRDKTSVGASAVCAYATLVMASYFMFGALTGFGDAAGYMFFFATLILWLGGLVSLGMAIAGWIRSSDQHGADT